MPHQIFGTFRTHSLTESENLRAPHVKAAPNRFQRTTHATTAISPYSTHKIRTTRITHAKATPDIFTISSPQKKPVLGPFKPLEGSAFQQMQSNRIDQDFDKEDQQYKKVFQRLQLQRIQLNSLKNTLDTITVQLQNQQQQFSILTELQNTIANLVQHLQGQQPPQQVPPDPPKPPEPIVIQVGLNKSIVKELSKKVYSFPKLYKLQGPENFDQ